MATGRYLIILLIGWMIASCTKEVVTVIDVPKEIEKSTISIKISLGSDVGTRSGWTYDDYFPSAIPTPEESTVSNVLLIIFKNIYLEEYALYESEGVNGDFTLDESTNTITLHKAEDGENEIDLEPGVHFFYAILNIPEGLYQEIEPLLENGKYTLTKESFEKQVMEVGLDYLQGGGTGGNGFIMTNSTPPASTVVYSESQLEEFGRTENEISISVGRALVKISLAYVPEKTGELHGALEDIKYTVVNHPSQMYLMPVIEDEKLITPHYTTMNIPVGYFIDPIRELAEKEKNREVNWLTATTEKKDKDTYDFAYCIENNVKKHLKSTTTGLVIRGEFVPSQWLNKDGIIGATTTDDSFWRIAEIDNDGYLLAYTKGYYNESPDSLCATMGSNFEVKKYSNDICYYTFWPSSNDEHQIKRNDFHKIVITHIHGAGAPDIDEIIDPDVDPDPQPTWERLVVYAVGWDDYPRIEELGEEAEGDTDNEIGVSIPGWEEEDSQEETLEDGDEKK